MNEQQLAAVKQALEALEAEHDNYRDYGDEDGAPEYIHEAIISLQFIISQDALYKMAEESRISGLRFDDWDKIGCVNHDCNQCKSVQEPVAVVSGYYGGQCVVLPTNPARLFNSGTAFYTAPQPVPVKTYHDGKPWPVAPKPWAGLDEDEVEDCARGCANHAELARAIEAKLKEKNHG